MNPIKLIITLVLLLTFNPLYSEMYNVKKVFVVSPFSIDSNFITQLYHRGIPNNNEAKQTIIYASSEEMNKCNKDQLIEIFPKKEAILYHVDWFNHLRFIDLKNMKYIDFEIKYSNYITGSEIYAYCINKYLNSWKTINQSPVFELLVNYRDLERPKRIARSNFISFDGLPISYISSYKIDKPNEWNAHIKSLFYTDEFNEKYFVKALINTNNGFFERLSFFIDKNQVISNNYYIKLYLTNYGD